MSHTLNRKSFIRTTGLAGSSLICSKVFAANSILSTLISNGLSKTISSPNDILDFLNPNYLFLDSFLPDKQLMQCYEMSLGNAQSFPSGGQQIVIFCETMNITGKFSNPGGEVFIVCKNLVCSKNAEIDISGIAGMNATFQKTEATGDQPDGKNADNVQDNNLLYDLHGKNAGSCTIYFETIIGETLTISANGGNGGKGEDGAKGTDGRDGRNGRDDDGCPSCNGGSNGEDGIRPGNNGNGAIGGNGGDGGKITIFTPVDFEKKEDVGQILFSKENINILCSTKQGNGGTGGRGASANTRGGKGGRGGVSKSCTERAHPHGEDTCVEHDNGHYANGADRRQEHGRKGDDGQPGVAGKPGSSENINDYYSFLKQTPSSFLRVLVLRSEYDYLNNNYEATLKTLLWIDQMNLHSRAIQTTSSSRLSPYLEDEDISLLKSHFTKSSVYLNQINQFNDFFGNNHNYVTLLDSEYINDKISGLYANVLAIESLTTEMCTKNKTYSEAKPQLEGQRQKCLDRIEELKKDIQELNEFLFKLDDELRLRYTEISNFQQRILEKEERFREAVENASQGCSLANVLKTLSTVVSIAAGVASGVGAFTSAMSVLSDTGALANELASQAEVQKPWLSPRKWDKIVQSNDKSIIKRVKSIRDNAGKFKDNVAGLKNAFENDNEKENTLIAFTYDSTKENSMTKEEFIKEMKEFVDKFPAAKEYQDEVLAYMDYCDLTNRKRQEFTHGLLTVINDQANIDQLNNDVTVLAKKIQANEAVKVTSASKILFLDSYLSAKQFLLKLVYLQCKSLDYFTLSPIQFDSRFYNVGVSGLNDTYINSNQTRLVNYLENAGFGRSREHTARPISIALNEYPITLNAFKLGETVGDKKLHTFMFRLSPKKLYYLDGDWSEIYITSATVIIRGIRTNTGFVSFKLKHFGDPTFFTSEKKMVRFSHRPVVKSLTYNTNTGKYYPQSQFSEIAGDFKLNGKNPFVGISPFAHWSIQIDPNAPLNEGLDLSQVTDFDFNFDFFQRPFM